MRSAQAKLLIEAPVNGGRNYEEKDEQSRPYCSYVNKPGYMLETPWILRYSPLPVAVKIRKVRTISRKGRSQDRNPQRLHARLRQSTRESRMIQSDLHSDMQEGIQVRSLDASRAIPIPVSIETK